MKLISALLLSIGLSASRLAASALQRRPDALDRRPGDAESDRAHALRPGPARSSRLGRRKNRVHIELRRRRISHHHRGRPDRAKNHRRHRSRSPDRSARPDVRRRKIVVHRGRRESRRQHRSRDTKVDLVLGTGQNRTHMVYVTEDLKRIVTSDVASATMTIIDKSAGGRGGPNWDRNPRRRRPWRGRIRCDGHPTVGRQRAGRNHFHPRSGQKKVTQTLDANVKSANRLKFTPDGKLALVSVLNGPDLSIFDVATKTLKKKIPIGHGAAGIEMQPDGSRAFVACTPDSYVVVIDLKTLESKGTSTRARTPTECPGASPYVKDQKALFSGFTEALNDHNFALPVFLPNTHNRVPSGVLRLILRLLKPPLQARTWIRGKLSDLKRVSARTVCAIPADPPSSGARSARKDIRPTPPPRPPLPPPPSKTESNSPQAAIESGAFGSSSDRISRARRCFIGTQ